MKCLALALASKVKSLASKVKSLALVLVSKPASPQKYPVLGSRTALFFDLLKMCHGNDQFSFVLKNAKELAKIFLKAFIHGEHLEFPKIFRNFGVKIFF